MPFTLAHPAIIIPLKKPLKKWGVLSALAIGSMTPDFSYFLPFGIDRNETHTFLALFWFCLPVGLCLFYVYHSLLSPVLLHIVPKGFQQRLNKNMSLGVLPKASILAVIISILIGASSHIIWDLFTHPPHSLPTFMRSWMTIVLIQFDGYTFYVFRLLQQISSVLGLAYVIYRINLWYKNTPAIQRPIWKPSPSTIKITRIIFFLPILIGLYYAYLSASYIIENINASSAFVVIMALRDFIIYGGRYLLLIWSLLGIAYFLLRRQNSL